jgi:hypothetical protein
MWLVPKWHSLITVVSGRTSGEGTRNGCCRLLPQRQAPLRWRERRVGVPKAIPEHANDVLERSWSETVLQFVFRELSTYVIAPQKDDLGEAETLMIDSGRCLDTW